MNFSGVNYLGTALKFRNGKKNLSSLVYRPPQNSKLGIFTSQLCRDGKEKKCTKKEKRDGRAESLFCSTNLLPF